MKANDYIPHPIDTSDIALPEDLIALAEQIARNVHEEWAAERLRQGWSYGPQRNDHQKTHPCLVPYEQLTEKEKQFDRNTCLSTLRLIQKMGFQITPKEKT